MSMPDKILAYWLDEVGPEGWYRQDDEVDEEIRARFLGTWEGLMQGRYALWLTYPSGALAYIILADQFPRNMFRGEAKAFSSDAVAMAASKQSIHRGWDMKIDPPARQFFYLPLMHSENACDQDRCVRLMKERLGAEGEDNLLHARVHREIIRRFGRFPYRNDALGRKTWASEKAFFDEGGYVRLLNELKEGVPA